MGGLPRLVKPMLASLRHELPKDDDRYGWEFKWDGVRAIAYITGGRVRLVPRSDRDMTGSYPELAVLAVRVAAPVILEGEIVALRDGRPDFGLLQTRMHVRQPPARLVREAPVHLYVFDLLHRGGESLLAVRYTGRRAGLEDLALDEDRVRTPPWYQGGADDILTVSAANGLEGVVGKPLASRYHPGARGEWIKVKNIRHQEVIVCGWTTGEGRRAHLIGSLLAGAYDRHRLRYIGHVGTGFTQAMLADLMRRLRPLQRDTSPFEVTVPGQPARAVHWVEPRLVGEVAFTEWTAEMIMRHPSWRGLRADKKPGQVRLEGWREPGRPQPGRPEPPQPGSGLERRFVGVGLGPVGSPRVGVGAAARVALTAGGPTAGGTGAPRATGRSGAGGPLSAIAGHLVHLGRGVAQRGTHIVHLNLIDGALLAFLGLIRPLPQPPGHDHPHPPGQRLGRILRRLPPHIARQEQRITVLPLTRRVVTEPRRRRHPEPRHRLTRRGKAQFRIIDKIPRDRDRGIACCHEQTSLLSVLVSSVLSWQLPLTFLLALSNGRPTIVPQVSVQRVYDDPQPGQGARVLVDRIWPRGLRKEAAHLDEWARDVAPSGELRTWYGHDPVRFGEFRRRYIAELAH